MSRNSNSLPSLNANAIWDKLILDIQMPDAMKETMKAQFATEFTEWLTTKNVSESDAIKFSAEADFRLIFDFATIASDLSRRLQKPVIQVMSGSSQIPVAASDPENPNQLSGNTTMVSPPNTDPSSQIGDAHMSPTRGHQLKTG